MKHARKRVVAGGEADSVVAAAGEVAVAVAVEMAVVAAGVVIAAISDPDAQRSYRFSGSLRAPEPQKDVIRL